MSNITITKDWDEGEVNEYSVFLAKAVMWGVFVTMAIMWANLTPWIGSIIEYVADVRLYEYTEELSKCLACLLGAPFAILSTLFFAVGEMFQYVGEYGPKMEEVDMFWDYFWFRAYCAVEHMLYLLIHLIGWRMASKHKSLWVRLQVRTNAYIIAVAFHIFHNVFLGHWMLWNVFA